MKSRLFTLALIIVMLLSMAMPTVADETTTVTSQTTTEWEEAGYPEAIEQQIATELICCDDTSSIRKDYWGSGHA